MALPTSSPNQPLLTITQRGITSPVTMFMLAKAFTIMIQALGLNEEWYSLHSLRRGCATSAYRAGADLLEVKRHGLWSSDTFRASITSLSTSTSHVALHIGSRSHRYTCFVTKFITLPHNTYHVFIIGLVCGIDEVVRQAGNSTISVVRAYLVKASMSVIVLSV